MGNDRSNSWDNVAYSAKVFCMSEASSDEYRATAGVRTEDVSCLLLRPGRPTVTSRCVSMNRTFSPDLISTVQQRARNPCISLVSSFPALRL